MVTIDMSHENYKNAFADAKVGDSLTLTITVSKVTDTAIVGELDSYEGDEDEAEAEPAAQEPESAKGYSKSKPPKGVMIAIGNMK